MSPAESSAGAEVALGTLKRLSEIIVVLPASLLLLELVFHILPASPIIDRLPLISLSLLPAPVVVTLKYISVAIGLYMIIHPL